MRWELDWTRCSGRQSVDESDLLVGSLPGLDLAGCQDASPMSAISYRQVPGPINGPRLNPQMLASSVRNVQATWISSPSR